MIGIALLVVGPFVGIAFGTGAVSPGRYPHQGSGGRRVQHLLLALSVLTFLFVAVFASIGQTHRMAWVGAGIAEAAIAWLGTRFVLARSSGRGDGR